MEGERHYYHVYNRGCGGETIFTRRRNYEFLLGRVETYLTDYPLGMIAYCLMPNHYHFLLSSEETYSLSRFVQRLFNSYTQAFNKQQRRRGTLFEGRARRVHVDTDKYVIHLCRYIHLNPVKAGLVEGPGEWPYSNFHEWVGQRQGILIDQEFVKQYFSKPEEYEEFVFSELSSAIEDSLRKYFLD
ncbi:MAG: transposase [Anaerolineales bacterium]|nr:transposase [Anaerolineales bacterium]